MGKLKQALIEQEEASFNALDIDYGNRGLLRNVPPASREQWVSYGMADQRDWAEFEKEFNAWLDAYESSFGSEL
jgi:hypothetical protein